MADENTHIENGLKAVTADSTEKNEAVVLTEEQIREQVEQEAWEKKVAGIKAKHPGSFLLEVEDKKAFLKKMDRKVLSMASTLGADDHVRVAELILDACWIEGDEEIRSDDDYFIPSIAHIKELMTIKTASLKKL